MRRTCLGAFPSTSISRTSRPSSAATGSASALIFSAMAFTPSTSRPGRLAKKKAGNGPTSFRRPRCQELATTARISVQGARAKARSLGLGQPSDFTGVFSLDDLALDLQARRELAAFDREVARQDRELFYRLERSEVAVHLVD